VFDFPENQNTLRRYAAVLHFARTDFDDRALDVAIYSRFEYDTRFVSFLLCCSGASVRIGFAEDVSQARAEYNRTFNCYYTRVLNARELKHEVEHELDVLRAPGGAIENDSLEIWTSQKDAEFAKALLAQNRVDRNNLIVACCPGAGHPCKRWPIENFADICARLIKEFNARIIIFGGESERALAEQLSHINPGSLIDTTGQTTLRQSAALLGRCTLYLGNDTGLVHSAMADSVQDRTARSSFATMLRILHHRCSALYCGSEVRRRFGRRSPNSRGPGDRARFKSTLTCAQ
jgi:ADP-heptose:LPS heptosyltransferase